MVSFRRVAAVTAAVMCVSPVAVAHAEPGADASRQPSAADRAPLTPEQAQAQVREATALMDDLKKNDADLAAASGRLATLAATSNALMSALTQARADEAKAKATEAHEIAELKRLSAEVTKAQQDLENMAVDAYVNGSGALRQVAAVIDLVTGGHDSDAAADATFLARSRNADQAHFEDLARRQQVAAQKAAAARADREKKTAQVEAAQKKAAEAVAQQQASVLALQKLAGDRQARLEQLGVHGGLYKGIDMDSLASIATTPLCTEENATYPNGLWPATALCGLKSAPGHMLRPSAARAFDAMAAAYLKANGTNLCVTDSYRSLAAQIDVKRRKPTLAAKPGTSNHGLGLAVDLCGGIESFGTAQHIWMQQNAPLFGFFHPAWAEPSGSKPEPWHWEFAADATKRVS